MNYEQALAMLKSYRPNVIGDWCGLFDTAIEVIEKQIPKKPTYTGEKNVYGAIARICNECGDKVLISPMAKEYENYCRSCGKRLTDLSEV